METVTLKWQGAEPTLVRLKVNAEKIELKQGDTFECSKEHARTLMKYSRDYVQVDGAEVKAFPTKQEQIEEKKKKAVKTTPKKVETPNPTE